MNTDPTQMTTTVTKSRSPKLSKLRATPAMNQALAARWAELDDQLAEEGRRRAEAAAAAKVVALEPKARPQLAAVPALPAPEPLRAMVAVLIWAADVPIVLPDPMIPDRLLDLVRATCAAIQRKAEKKPGDARRLAVMMERALGVTADDAGAAWAPVRSLIGDLGPRAVAQDVAELAGKRRWRDKPLASSSVEAVAAAKARAKAKAKERQDAKFSDGPTKERAAKSTFTEEPIYIETQGAGPKGKDRILVGRPVRDDNVEARTRLERFEGLDTSHVNAGARFASEWERAGLEPRLTANLMGVGGGGKRLPSAADGWAAGLSLDVMKARNGTHLALQALRLGGDEVVGVVEAIVLRGDTAKAAGSSRYADRQRGAAHVAACLKAGLNLLVMHYRLRGTAEANAASAKERA